MNTLDEQISRCIIENRDRLGSIDFTDQKAMKDEIMKCFADYIQSIELPKKRTKAYSDNDEYHIAIGYNQALADCQQVLDNKVKELRG